MTIASEANRSGPYVCNGVTTSFPYEFRIYDEAHIRVILTDPQGIETMLSLGTDYTVSGVGQSVGGAIDMAVAHAAGYRVTLILNVPFTQDIDLENQGAYFAETIERAIDLQTQMSLQLKEQVGRAVVLPVTSSVSVDRLTGAVLSLSDIQPQMLALVPITGDIETVAGIAGAVVAAEGHANTATAAAGVATSKAAEAAASAAAAALFDPTSYYLKTAFKDDGIASAPAKYGAAGQLTGKDIYINDAPGLNRWVMWMTNGLSRWSMRANATPEDGGNTGSNFQFDAFDDAGVSLGTVYSVSRTGRSMAFSVSPSAPTPASGDVSTKLATTAFVKNALAGGGLKNVRVVTASGNVTPSAGVTKWLAIVCGGGGAGQGRSTVGIGNGGFGGGATIALADVDDSTAYAATVGAGGTGVSNTHGNNGGASSLVIGGHTYTGTGGPGSATIAPVVGSGGLVNLPGGPRDYSYYVAGSEQSHGGSGGDGPLGLGFGGLGGGGGTGAYGGGAATGYGAGGGGACVVTANGTFGGAGSPGIIIILEF